LKIAIINGPNLDRLGAREADHYGTLTLAAIEKMIAEQATTLGVEVSFFQSNHEGALVDYIGDLPGKADGIIINPAAYTHTSVAIRDALIACRLAIVEVHLSNIHKREEFRHRSFVADIAEGQISGLGAAGYLFALQYLAGGGGDEPK
jgi:3-dehydroquinate dehydratase II